MRAAEMILVNGKIYSIRQNGERISGTAVAISEGTILKIGSDSEVMSLKTDETEVIDCQGNTILPGFGDVHCHPSIACSTAEACDLFGIYTDDTITARDALNIYKERLKEYVDAHPEKELIRGTGWVIYNFMGTDVWPTRQDIDEICSDRPVILESFCQHNLWVNTKAIEMAGVDENTPEVKAGKIFREDDGYPAGVFKEPEAMEYIKMGVPGYDLSVEEYKDALLTYQYEYANKFGVTMIQDCMHSDNARQAYLELAKEGKLTVYARGVYLLEPDKFKDQLPEFIKRKGKDHVGNDFRVDTIKIFSEGDYKFIDPYTPEFCKESGYPEDYNGGQTDWQDDDFAKYIRMANEAGFSVHVHAMADRAILQTVRAMQKAQEGTDKSFRNTIAHLMLVPDECYEIMAKENIIANLQMRWMLRDGDIIALEGMLGLDRARRCFPMRGFIDKGVVIAAGTDFPVTPPPDVMHEIQCALTRTVFPEVPDYEKLRGHVLGEEKPAELSDAIKALTVNSAYQIFTEAYTGSLEKGKSAEVVILDSDIENVPIEQIYKIKVQKTIFKGKVVYDKDLA